MDVGAEKFRVRVYIGVHPFTPIFESILEVKQFSHLMEFVVDIPNVIILATQLII